VLRCWVQICRQCCHDVLSVSTVLEAGVGSPRRQLLLGKPQQLIWWAAPSRVRACLMGRAGRDREPSLSVLPCTLLVQAQRVCLAWRTRDLPQLITVHLYRCIQQCQPAWLPACLPVMLTTASCLPACLPVCLPACLLTAASCLPACLCACLPACLPACHADGCCLPACLPADEGRNASEWLLDLQAALQTRA
jgi:hypothetical protein